MITGIICLIGFAIGTVYVTPGGQAILELVDYFGGGFIIFVIAIIEVIAVRWVNTTLTCDYLYTSDILTAGSMDCEDCWLISSS